jgi:hypothetical protein
MRWIVLKALHLFLNNWGPISHNSCKSLSPAFKVVATVVICYPLLQHFNSVAFISSKIKVLYSFLSKSIHNSHSCHMLSLTLAFYLCSLQWLQDVTNCFENAAFILRQ